MESTNELVTAYEAAAEGLNIQGSNECITKQEFVDNLPVSGEINLTGINTYQYTLVINNSSKNLTGKVIQQDSNEINFTLNRKDVYSFYSVYDIRFYGTGDTLVYDSQHCSGNMSNTLSKYIEQSVRFSDDESINSGYDNNYVLQVIIIRDR